MRCRVLAIALLSLAAVCVAEESDKKKHHRRHHHKHHKVDGKKIGKSSLHTKAVHQEHHSNTNSHTKKTVQPSHAIPATAQSKHVAVGSSEEEIVNKMKALEADLSKKEKNAHSSPHGPAAKLEVNGPLPFDFADRFAKAVAAATGSAPTDVRVTAQTKLSGVPGDVREIQFIAPAKVVSAVQDQAADPDSSLARGNLHSFLVAHDDEEATPEVSLHAEETPEETPVQEDGIDIDTAMPYGELEPFGREDTAQELTEQSVKESDEMVDQLERAEVAEEKRAVFRALTRLRGAAITSFDGIARSQTGNIDEYNKLHKWRRTHPLHHLADEESDISKWAFPDNADF